MPSQTEDFARTKQIRILRESGASYGRIGRIFKISRERARQIHWKNEVRHIIDGRVERGEIKRGNVPKSLARVGV